MPSRWLHAVVAMMISMIVAALMLCARPIEAAPVRTAHVEAELVSDRAGIEPGQTTTIAVRLKMERGWHTYWQNPGESGLPTSVVWKLPAGLAAGALQWPAPKTLKAGPLVNHGYDGEVLLLTDMHASAALAQSPVTLGARVDWLVCKEVCIPEGADLSLTLPVGPASTSAAKTAWTEAIERTRAGLPKPLQDWQVEATGSGSRVELALIPQSTVAADPGDLHFFPFEDGKIEASGAQVLLRKGNAWTLTLPVASRRKGDFTRVAGVLVASRPLSASGNTAATVDVPLKGAVVAGTAQSSQLPVPIAAGSGSASLGVALVFAFIGGLLLNLMPCVFPVLSLKVLGFAAHGESRAAMRLHGLAFVAGVFVSFWLLAGSLLAFRATGAQLGWGFQLQSPLVVAALALLFFVLALNLSGVFEVRQIVPSSIASWNARNAYVNDALSGVLAVVVASPCSAPFMGAALGFALTEPPASTLLIFTALACGMAAPYLLLATFPGWRSRLPRPGPWMVRLKQVLAFPLYATVIWLCWILGVQLDNDAVARLALVLLLVAASLWSWQAMRAGGSQAWGYAAAAVLAMAAFVSWPILTAVTGSAPADASSATRAVPESAAGAWGEYAPERLAQLTAEGKPVFVDFTAAWCVTCQVNKRLVLDTPAMDAAFTRANVVLLRADWTRRDPEIARALAALGRNGVPVYVLYRPNNPPLVLPEVLQQRTVLDALATLS